MRKACFSWAVPTQWARCLGPYAIELLEWALDDDNQFVRLEAAKALGERGINGSIEKLQSLYPDKHTIVCDMAAVSLLRILV